MRNRSLAQELKHIERYDFNLYTALTLIPHMDLDWRKWMLDVCQTGLPLSSSHRLYNTFSILYSTKNFTHDGHPVPITRFYDICDSIANDRLFSSIISIHLRSEVALCDDLSDEVLFKTVSKEINASQTQRTHKVRFGALQSYMLDGLSWDPEYPITPAWISGAQQFCTKLCTLIGAMSHEVIFPAVQRRKNMSQESCSLLYQDGYKPRESRWDSLTTLDLEIHAARTGKKILGENELRWAWKYNDLKPRAYYTSGGKAYWRSRHMPRIAVTFMNSLPNTTTSRRSFPASITDQLLQGDWVVIWDLSNFTTNLVELRFFLFWVARLLEQDPGVRNSPLHLFDYAEGVIEANIWDLLDEYNEEVNCYSAYSLHRLIDDLGLDDIDGHLQATHVNSGPLGVHGNIGFSTTVHGLNTASIAKSFNASAVIGDDVLAIIDEDPEEMELERRVRLLGEIPADKFGKYELPDEWVEDRGWKFVKRPLRINQDGIWIGEQLNLPILAYVFRLESKNRKFFRDDSYDKILHRFAGQVSAFLWELQKCDAQVQSESLPLLKAYLSRGYHQLGLDIKGALPGKVVRKNTDKAVLSCAVPSIQFDEYNPILVDWAEELWDRVPQTYAKLPINAGCDIFPEYFEDQYCTGTGSKLFSVLSDLGHVEKGRVHVEWVKVNETNKRRFREWLHGDVVPLIDFRWLKPPPFWYYDLAIRRLDSRFIFEEEHLNWGVYTRQYV
jgi:hypothetical protein